MELIRRLDSAQTRDCVVTIGSFDGIHIGHRALIERLRGHARRLSLPAVVLSFEPLPREYLRAADPPARLTNLRERWRVLEGSGVEQLCLLPFNARLRGLSAVEFMQLLHAARARVVVIGHDFRFGRGGAASAEWCAEQAAGFGFSVDVMDPLLLDGERVSSGRVRQALGAADLRLAARLLGRPYSMRGRVRLGNRLGRRLGFPTANLALKRRRTPLDGVFAVRVNGPGFGRWPGVASLGTRPTVDGKELLLEAHLFDFERDLYGHELEVQFVARLRSEQKFESLEAMVQQMQLDAALSRRMLEQSEESE
jgi:riboflavin kinase/FMN adenylyltransferase